MPLSSCHGEVYPSLYPCSQPSFLSKASAEIRFFSTNPGPYEVRRIIRSQFKCCFYVVRLCLPILSCSAVLSWYLLASDLLQGMMCAHVPKLCRIRKEMFLNFFYTERLTICSLPSSSIFVKISTNIQCHRLQ